MNLLVTNTRNAQAYAIIRALRPHANKIVATMEGENWLAARLSHAANSRLVDKRYYTPSPAEDWRAGRIQKENTKRSKFNKALYKLYMAIGSRWIPAARNRRMILKAGSRAARNYNPKAYPGKITLFRATDLGGGISHDSQMGWDRLAGGELETHLIPGYHAHIVLEPRVRLLARELTAVLSKTQEFVREAQSNADTPNSQMRVRSVRESVN